MLLNEQNRDLPAEIEVGYTPGASALRSGSRYPGKSELIYDVFTKVSHGGVGNCWIPEVSLSIILHKDFKLSPYNRKFKIKEITVAEMGLTKDNASWKNIRAWIEENYALLPQDTALWLRMAHSYQQDNDWLYVAAEPSPDYDGRLSLLKVENNGSSLVHPHLVGFCSVGCIFPLTSKFVVALKE